MENAELTLRLLLPTFPHRSRSHMLGNFFSNPFS